MRLPVDIILVHHNYNNITIYYNIYHCSNTVVTIALVCRFFCALLSKIIQGTLSEVPRNIFPPRRPERQLSRRCNGLCRRRIPKKPREYTQESTKWFPYHEEGSHWFQLDYFCLNFQIKQETDSKEPSVPWECWSGWLNLFGFWPCAPHTHGLTRMWKMGTKYEKWRTRHLFCLTTSPVSTRTSCDTPPYEALVNAPWANFEINKQLIAEFTKRPLGRLPFCKGNVELHFVAVWKCYQQH